MPDHKDSNGSDGSNSLAARFKRLLSAIATSLTLSLILDVFTIVPVAACECWLWSKNAGPLALTTKMSDMTPDLAMAFYIIALIIGANVLILLRFGMTIGKYEQAPGARGLRIAFLAILLTAGVLFSIYAIKVLTQMDL